MLVIWIPACAGMTELGGNSAVARHSAVFSCNSLRALRVLSVQSAFFKHEDHKGHEE
jgi:hypothetical protein